MTPLNPTPIHTRPPAALVAAIRKRHNLTQLQCAHIVAVQRRTWIGFETKDQAMHLSTWWLFLLRTGEINMDRLPPIPPRQRSAPQQPA